ncbi:hypothetical protein [Bifidobacterium psychraerophilum]|uniref:hypothetical protein n=1 Tax=Bifidobacterium psychraerophilum TaxID=218140 RepID=UPI003341544D
MMYAMNFFGVIFLWALGTGITTTVLYYTVKQAVKNGMDESTAGQNTTRKTPDEPDPDKDTHHIQRNSMFRPQ